MISNNNITVVAPDCGSYFLHQKFNWNYNTPFVDNYISIPNYLEIIRNFNNIDFSNIHEVNKEMYLREGGENVETEYDYPVVCLDNRFIIHPMHCTNFQEFKTKWRKRVERMNFHNLLFIFCDYDEEHPEYLEEFIKLTDKKARIVYTKKEIIESIKRTRAANLSSQTSSLESMRTLFMDRTSMDMNMYNKSFEGDAFKEFIRNIKTLSRI